MIKIKFPDGNVKEFESGVTGLDIARGISSKLAKEVLSISVNGEIWDLTRPITADAEIKLFTWDDQEGKHAFWHYGNGICRHDGLAEAVCYSLKRHHGNGYKSVLGSYGQTRFYALQHHLFIRTHILMGKVQAAVAFEAEYYAHHCRKSLCKHCGKCRSACAKLQD